ncbi:hypothetical protein ScalyP_jg9603 [Parmales sp. scaly parma]|nr:hypothetical protein ScalyP_jg9603 [Parmales sp. scaly parma]
MASLLNPESAISVATFGDVSSSAQLLPLLKLLESTPTGLRILVDRPTPPSTLTLHNNLMAKLSTLPPNTFGNAYWNFMKTHEFHSHERPPVVYVDDENLAYVMDRYRTSHDYWHVITGLPPTVEGELALKWIEYINMGLPVAGLSGLAGEFGAFAENRFGGSKMTKDSSVIQNIVSRSQKTKLLVEDEANKRKGENSIMVWIRFFPPKTEPYLCLG